jgi:hypothetical protein
MEGFPVSSSGSNSYSNDSACAAALLSWSARPFLQDPIPDRPPLHPGRTALPRMLKTRNIAAARDGLPTAHATRREYLHVILDRLGDAALRAAKTGTL